MKTNVKTEKRERRHKRIRSKVHGTAERPRLAVFRSNRYVYAQIINDELGKTLVAASSAKLPGKGVMEKAKAVGVDIAKKAKDLKIDKVVFDRAGFIFTGKIRAIADGAREGGLKF